MIRSGVKDAQPADKEGAGDDSGDGFRTHFQPGLRSWQVPTLKMEPPGLPGSIFVALRYAGFITTSVQSEIPARPEGSFGAD